MSEQTKPKIAIVGASPNIELAVDKYVQESRSVQIEGFYDTFAYAYTESMETFDNRAYAGKLNDTMVIDFTTGNVFREHLRTYKDIRMTVIAHPTGRLTDEFPTIAQEAKDNDLRLICMPEQDVAGTLNVVQAVWLTRKKLKPGVFDAKMFATGIERGAEVA